MKEWISVKDHIPDKSMSEILVYSTGKHMHVVRFDYGGWCLWEMDNGFCGEEIEFTHWMPLPNPPQ